MPDVDVRRLAASRDGDRSRSERLLAMRGNFYEWAGPVEIDELSRSRSMTSPAM